MSRDTDLAAARERLLAVLAEAKRRRDAAPPRNDPIVSDGPGGLSRWVMAALIVLALVAGWMAYRELAGADRDKAAPAGVSAGQRASTPTLLI